VCVHDIAIVLRCTHARYLKRGLIRGTAVDITEPSGCTLFYSFSRLNVLYVYGHGQEDTRLHAAAPLLQLTSGVIHNSATARDVSLASRQSLFACMPWRSINGKGLLVLRSPIALTEARCIGKGLRSPAVPCQCDRRVGCFFLFQGKGEGAIFAVRGKRD
jgi:hypothetical protein